GRVHDLFGDTSGGNNGAFLLDHASLIRPLQSANSTEAQARTGSGSTCTTSSTITPAARRSRTSNQRLRISKSDTRTKSRIRMTPEESFEFRASNNPHDTAG